MASSFAARCISGRGNTIAPLADFAQALVVNPSSATALYGRGMVKRMTGDARGGEEDIETAKAMRAGVAEQSAARGVR